MLLDVHIFGRQFKNHFVCNVHSGWSISCASSCLWSWLWFWTFYTCIHVMFVNRYSIIIVHVILPDKISWWTTESTYDNDSFKTIVLEHHRSKKHFNVEVLLSSHLKDRIYSGKIVFPHPHMITEWHAVTLNIVIVVTLVGIVVVFNDCVYFMYDVYTFIDYKQC